MKDESLGANHFVSGLATVQTVRPLSSAVSCGQRSTAPPHVSSGNPRCFWYQAASADGSLLLLKNTTPMPVTLATGRSPKMYGATCYWLPASRSPHQSPAGNPVVRRTVVAI